MAHPVETQHSERESAVWVAGAQACGHRKFRGYAERYVCYFGDDCQEPRSERCAPRVGRLVHPAWDDLPSSPVVGRHPSDRLPGAGPVDIVFGSSYDLGRAAGAAAATIGPPSHGGATVAVIDAAAALPTRHGGCIASVAVDAAARTAQP